MKTEGGGGHPTTERKGDEMDEFVGEGEGK
jgi:hypothetical protein